MALLWPHVLNDLEFHFAYQAFKWANSAKANAGVTCVIIGIRQRRNHPKRLFGASVVRSVENINPYLVAGRNVFVGKRRRSISGMPPCDFGNMPNDGGGLMLRPEERESLLGSHPPAAKFVRRLLGTEEFIDGKSRFCLWINETQLREASKIAFIAGRIAAVRAHREDSDREATNRLAARSHQFGEVRHQEGAALLVPLHTSENREYIPIGFITSSAIITNSAIAVYQAEPGSFGVISSRMHMVWARAVAGGLETRVRYSSSICYNNFPFPALTPAQREEIARSAECVLVTRERYPEKTIAWLYDPDTMPADLLAAHRTLDSAVEQCYRAKPFTSDEERLEYLFALFEQMTAAEAGELFAAPASLKAKAKTKKT